MNTANTIAATAAAVSSTAQAWLRKYAPRYAARQRAREDGSAYRQVFYSRLGTGAANAAARADAMGLTPSNRLAKRVAKLIAAERPVVIGNPNRAPSAKHARRLRRDRRHAAQMRGGRR